MSSKEPRRVSSPTNDNHPDTEPKVLFLGYDSNQTSLVEEFNSRGYRVWHCEDPVSDLGDWDLVVSFGYRHILKPDVLATAKRPPVNLHIAFLPYNRGAHPNFWALYDGTPSGVTIHEIDSGVDTGPILFQKPVAFAPDERTFQKTHNRLLSEIEALFKENIVSIIDGSAIAYPQRGKGSYHRKADLPAGFPGWDKDIYETLDSLSRQSEASQAEKLELIDAIEKIRTNNNVNWMDLLRLAFRVAPEEARELVKRINTDDRRISELFSKLGM